MSRLETADAVIVGGGVVGCSLAYELAARGVDTVLLERGTLGGESTGKNAGGIRQQFSTEINVRIQMLSVRILDAFEETTGVDPGFRRLGYLFVLSDEETASRYRDLVQMWGELGLTDARWVTPDEIAELAPAVAGDDVLGGTFCPSDGVASPADVTYGYASAARRAGAQLHEHREVEAINVVNSRVTGVCTPSGSIACATVFICAGAWAAQVAGLAGVELPVTPYRRHIFLTGGVDGINRHSPFTVDAASTFYFHPEGDGALVGMSDLSERPGFDTRTDWSFLERITEVAQRRAPGFLDAEIRTGWAGLYEVTPDNQPIVGPLGEPDGLWGSCGYSGHGFMQAPATGRLLAELYVGGEAAFDLTPFAYDRFQKGVLVPERNVV